MRPTVCSASRNAPTRDVRPRGAKRQLMRAAEEVLDDMLDIAARERHHAHRDRRLRPGRGVRGSRAPVRRRGAAPGLRLRVTRRLPLRSDRVLLRRVSNLISNALRYTQRGACWSLPHRERGSRSRCDTDRASRSSTSRRSSTSSAPRPQFALGRAGPGLGLSICDRIARLLDSGQPAVSSGRGSVFAYACRSARRPAQPRDARAVAAPPRVSSCHVLCVDNEPRSWRA